MNDNLVMNTQQFKMEYNHRREEFDIDLKKFFNKYFHKIDSVDEKNIDAM